MRYTLKQEIINAKDCILNDDIKVKDGKVYVKAEDREYLYDNSWHIKVGANWVDLQGGIPNVELSERIENELFDILFESDEAQENG